MKICFITNNPSPYRMDFFNELAKYCKLTVLFERNMSPGRDKSWGEYAFCAFNAVFLQSSKEKTPLFSMSYWLKQNKFDHIILANIFSPVAIIAALSVQKNKTPYLE